MSENILGTEKIHKLFIKFCLPAVASMVIAGMQGMIDGIFVGNFTGELGLASVNIAQPFMQLIYGCTFVVCIGAISSMGRLLGEGNEGEAQDVFRTSMITVLVATLALTLVGTFFSKQVAAVLGANEEIISGVSTYIKTISLFAPFIALKVLFGFTDRIIGRPEEYLKATIVSVVVQIILNVIFLKFLGLGIGGAALATGISNIAGFFVVLPYILNKKNKINLFKGKFNSKIIWPVCYNGSSEGVTSISTAVATFLFNMAFMEIAGPAGVAAFTAITYMANFGILLMFGISDGVTPIISYNFGDDNKKRVRESMKLSIISTFIIGLVIFLILVVFSTPLVKMFTSTNIEVINLASSGAKIYAFAFLINGFNIVTSGYFTAIGNAKASIIVSGSRGLVFIIVGIFVLPMFLGVNGIWFTVPFAEIVTVFIGIYILKKH